MTNIASVLYMYFHTHVYMYVHTLYACMYIHMYTCMYMYIHVHCIMQDVGMPAEYVNKLARMFQDIKVSEDLNTEFKERHRGSPTSGD